MPTDLFDRMRVVDVDSHLTEPPDTWTARVPAKLRDRYGRNTFGWSLLIARQLVEAGVSMVQVNLGNDETWDTHGNAFPHLKNYLFPPTDRAVSALLDDLVDRGLLDSTLIVMAGEFGRTALTLASDGGRPQTLAVTRAQESAPGDRGHPVPAVPSGQCDTSASAPRHSRRPPRCGLAATPAPASSVGSITWGARNSSLRLRVR